MNLDQHIRDQASLASEGHSLAEGAPAVPSPSASQVADALERRIQEKKAEQQAAANTLYKPFDEEHDKRQEFRRMIDPAILRPNPKPVALESLKTLLKIAQNILQNPDEPKYLRFKPTNHMIKKTLVDPKGALEYAVAMGFHPEVENFQPYYVFRKHKHLRDLEIGAEILQEALVRESEKEERHERTQRTQKAAEAARVANAKQAFLDDRKDRTIIEKRERELREAKAAIAARRTSVPPASPDPSTMPGPGHSLRSVENVDD
ncbi:hypothetical protein BDY19DRAFT_990148 [Irpex rosettiformis]|uniref:Uncharacterized protein n=1 Tax=Irpex rosettiformis TaxID=378272 RepID=A0ACB8UDG6_9APHY|nr:hypothetical protein BDY19DRAFT_990148 [Irpex rosettiformis]